MDCSNKYSKSNGDVATVFPASERSRVGPTEWPFAMKSWMTAIRIAARRNNFKLGLTKTVLFIWSIDSHRQYAPAFIPTQAE